jgi:molecular chaperone GrpE (heat shock protein)
MRDSSPPTLSKLPFFVGDVLLLGTACLLIIHSSPVSAWEASFAVMCVAGGAVLAIAPFILEYQAVAKLAEAETLTTVVAQLQNLEKVAAQIHAATGQWQSVQEHADKTAASAKEIAERISAEARAFAEFMERANDNQKANLRLEVEKLRRAESDWLTVMVRVLDHVFALHQGALRSGQPNLIEQLGNFQNACRDAARRVGLTPFAPNPDEPFDAERHRMADADATPAADARVVETVATGYTFQGRLLRHALVRLSGNNAERAAAEAGAAEAPEAVVDQEQQSQLRLEPAGAPSK